MKKALIKLTIIAISLLAYETVKGLELLNNKRLWVYDYLENGYPYIIGQFMPVVLGDSIINGNACKIIEDIKNVSTSEYEQYNYAYIKDNVLYCYIKGDGFYEDKGFVEVFDFKSNKGDLYTECNQLWPIYDVDSIMVRNIKLKRFWNHTSTEMPAWIEGIGLTDYTYSMIPRIAVMTPHIFPIASVFENDSLICTGDELVPGVYENGVYMFNYDMSWTFTKVSRNNPHYIIDKLDVAVVGDTIDATGHLCKKISVKYESQPNQTYHYAVYERYNSIYLFNEDYRNIVGRKTPKLICLMSFNENGISYGDTYRIESDSIEIRGTKYLRHTVYDPTTTNSDGSFIKRGYWVKGIGASSTMALIEDGKLNESDTVLVMESCSKNGECIFRKDDFSRKSILENQYELNQEHTMSDLLGRNIKEGIPGQIVIKSGKKILIK